MRAIVFAYHNIGCVGIEALLRAGFEIAAVVTHPDDPRENHWFRSVAELAARHSIPVMAPADVNHPLVVEKIRALAPEILFSFYYRQVLGPELLSLPPRGCLNLHGSLLPRYRGRCPINWALINGETRTGVTLHHMTAVPDAGDIVAQEEVEITDDDTAVTLHGKCADAARRLLDRTLPAILDGTARAVPQDNARATRFPGRRPEDGRIDWSQSARAVRDLVRAVTRPYPGAFTYYAGKKYFVWQAAAVPAPETSAAPGTVLSASPLTVACGEGALRINFAQAEGGVYVSGAQLAADARILPHTRFDAARAEAREPGKVLILGVNGFIGSALSNRLLQSGRYEVYGMDLHSNYVADILDDPRFHFCEGDIQINREWVEYHIRKCDTVLPLVAIATPIEYTRNPLRVFELDFEENLRIVRLCHKYGKRVLFPSTSEVYAMCDDETFDEDTSRLVLGPICKQRWIYSCCKQMLDRVIWAYGGQGLKFTLFRPFNWIGPKLDSLASARLGSSRVITQFILNLVQGEPLLLIDGGRQRRCFTDVRDGVECLFRIIENAGNRCDGKIINIGAPENELSIRELAETLVRLFDAHPLRGDFPPFAGCKEIESSTYYGAGYQDCRHRKPSIRNAGRYCGWQPREKLEDAIARTLDFFLREHRRAAGEAAGAGLK